MASELEGKERNNHVLKIDPEDSFSWNNNKRCKFCKRMIH